MLGEGFVLVHGKGTASRRTRNTIPDNQLQSTAGPTRTTINDQNPIAAS